MAVYETQKDSDISSKTQEMSSPMFPEMSESATTSSRRGRRKARKIWRRPIRISRLPSFGFSGSDFTFDQIPAIFSGYTAGSEDSSSSEMSDASRSYSQSVSSADEHEEINHVRTRAVWKRASLKSVSRIPSMKLRRQLTRKMSGGSQTRQKLKKVRSVKRSSSRILGFRDDRSSRVLSGDAIGLSQPHYLRPTSSSASKKVGKTQNNLKPNLGARAKKFSGGLTRTRSLRYSGLRRATCSSAMKDSKMGNGVSVGKVCTYMYCSLHGRHSHPDNNVNTPSLKRFVSMRRRFLKRQKSTNRRLVLLKRSLSRKRGPATGRIVSVDQELGQVDVVVDGESSKEIREEHVSSPKINGDDLRSNPGPVETCDLSVVDVAKSQDDSSLAIGPDPTTRGNLCAGGEEFKPATTDESSCKTEGDMQKNAKLWRLICQQMVTGLSHEAGNSRTMKSEEPVEDSKKFCGVMQDEDDSKDVQSIDDKSKAVKLVKQALDEILSEITDYSSDDKSITGDKTSEHEHVKGEDDRELDVRISTSCDCKTQSTDLSDIASTSHTGEETNRRGPKNWSYLKKVVLLNRFLKSLENVRNFDRREPRNLSVESDQGEAETMRLRQRLIGERKSEEEWMLDYALRQVISTLAPSQKRKVERLVQAFETVIPVDSFRAHDLRRPSRAEAAHVDHDPGCTSSHLEKDSEAEKETIRLESNLRGNKDEATDLQEVMNRSMVGEPQSENGCCDDLLDPNTVSGEDRTEKRLTSEELPVSGCLKSEEAAKSLADASLYKEEFDGSGSSKEDEKKERDESRTEAEKQNLIKWRNLIYKHMVTGLTVHDTVWKQEHENTEELGSTDESRSSSCSSGSDQIASEKENDDAADSSSRAVKLVQQALEKILSEIPDRSLDEETVSASSNSSKEDSQGQNTAKSWNNLKKVVLLKRFVKSLEQVRKFKPRKPRYLPVESDLEVGKVILRRRSTQNINDAGKLMLDYALREAISKLAPFQRRKVALLVHAFDTVLDGGGEVIPLQDDQTYSYSATSVSDHETPKQSKTDIALNNGETNEEGFLPHLLEESPSSMIGQRPNLKKDFDFNVEERRITVDFSRLQGNQTDLKEKDGCSVLRESKPLASSVSDVKQRIAEEKEKDSKLWNLIYKHLVTGLQTPEEGTGAASGVKTLDNRYSYNEGEPLDSVEDECREKGGLKINARSSGVVTLVREALEKILSEIPDHSSDDQSIESDITTDQELFERHSESRDELVSSASLEAIATQVNPVNKNRDIAFKQKSEPDSRDKSNEKSVKGWSNLKRIILLRRFVKELGTLKKLSPTTPRTLPLESDPEAEKVNLRHQPLEGKKSSEEWMLDYALRQVISTLAPSQKRKVALLAQAFDTVSLQDIGSCSSPSTATSLRMSRQSSTSSLVQSGNDTCSEIGEARRLMKARDFGGLPEASIQIANPVNDQAKWESGYNKQEVPNYPLRDKCVEMNEAGIPVVPRNEIDDSGYCLEDAEKISMVKSRHPQEERGKVSEFAADTTNAAHGNDLEKQQCTSLWRLLYKHMESGVADNDRNQTFLEETSKEVESNYEPGLENHNSDSEKMEAYQTEAVKLLEEVIDGISLPESQDNDPRDGLSLNSDQKLIEETNTEKDGANQDVLEARQKTETEQTPQVRKGWSNLKKVILLKRFVKALEKVRKFNQREPQFLPLKSDPEAEKVNLRHQETQDKKNGEGWMIDYALQDVVAKLTPARKRKVQLLVQAFETVSVTGN